MKDIDLRDWFAGQAMAAIVSGNLAYEDGFYVDAPPAARLAYDYADALLAYRKEHPAQPIKE